MYPPNSALWPPSLDYSRKRFLMPAIAGRLDRNARHIYQYGQCHSLAAALGERLPHDPAPVRALVRDRPQAFIGQVVHCYIRTSSGAWLDILGLHDPADEMRYWAVVYPGESLRVEQLSIAQTRDLSTRRGYARVIGVHWGWVDTPFLPTCMPLARSHADALIRRRRLDRR